MEAIQYILERDTAEKNTSTQSNPLECTTCGYSSWEDCGEVGTCVLTAEPITAGEGIGCNPIEKMPDKRYDGINCIVTPGGDWHASSSTSPDPINPDYYKIGGIETIDYIEAKDLNYNLGNVVKYVSRAGHKDKDTRKQDLKKARFFLDREINK